MLINYACYYAIKIERTLTYRSIDFNKSAFSVDCVYNVHHCVSKTALMLHTITVTLTKGFW